MRAETGKANTGTLIVLIIPEFEIKLTINTEIIVKIAATDTSNRNKNTQLIRRAIILFHNIILTLPDIANTDPHGPVNRLKI